MARKKHTPPEPQVPHTYPRAAFVWNGYTIYRAHINPTARRLSPTKWAHQEDHP